MPSLHSDYQHQLIEFVSRIVLAVILVGSVVRPWVVELPMIFTLFGAFNTLCALVVYWVVYRRLLPRGELALLMGLGFLTLTPLQFLSGGVNSQYAYLMPMFPLAAALMGGVRMTVGVALVQIVLVGLMLSVGPQILDLTGEPYIQGKVLSRGIWLLIAIVASACIGTYFQRQNDALTARLEELATQDPLTSLLNRRGFDAQMLMELRRAKRLGMPLSLLLIDVDHFKSINDRFGHEVGDQCLKELAECLRQHTRDIDLVARFGGEEFVLLLVNTSLDEAQVIAENLRSKVEALSLPAVEGGFTITLGVAHGDNGPLESGAELLKQADDALYEGKRAGRNRVMLSSVATQGSQPPH